MPSMLINHAPMGLGELSNGEPSNRAAYANRGRAS